VVSNNINSRDKLQVKLSSLQEEKLGHHVVNVIAIINIEGRT
jgi:hypothetical protein